MGSAIDSYGNGPTGSVLSDRFYSFADADLGGGTDHGLQHPFNGVVLILLLGTGFYHASLGLQVVIEDYISTKSRRILILAFTKMMMTALLSFSIYSVLLITLTDGV